MCSNLGADAVWEVENLAQQQHQLVQYGSCALGVQGTSNGGVTDFFHVGAGDICSIVNGALFAFGWEGKVGAKGSMNCYGAPNHISVEWGLY